MPHINTPEYMKAWRKKRKELHLCEKCGKQDDYTLAGRCRCKACSEKANARRKAKWWSDPEYRAKHNKEKMDTYAWMKQHHYCRECKKVDAYTLAGRHLCAECSAKKAERDREKMRGNEKRRAYERRRKERMKRAGVCPNCGRTLPAKGYPYVTCERCRAKDRERRRRRREASGAVSRAMYKELGLCVTCGRPRIKDKLGCDGQEILLCERCYANALKWAEAGSKAFEEKYGFTYRSWATGNEFRAMKARKR